MRTRRPPGPTRITSSRPALIARRTVFSDTLSTPATSFTVINCCAWCGVELLGVLAIGALLIRVGGELLDIYRDHPSEQARQRQCGVSDVLIVRRMVWVFGLAGHAGSMPWVRAPLPSVSIVQVRSRRSDREHRVA